MSLGSVNCPIVFNIDSYNALPAQYKKLLEDVKDGSYAAQGAAYAAKDKINVEKWAKNPKLTAVKIPEDQMANFRKIAGERRTVPNTCVRGTQHIVGWLEQKNKAGAGGGGGGGVAAAGAGGCR